MSRLYSRHEVDWIERRLAALPIESMPLVIEHARSIDTYHAIERMMNSIADLRGVGLTLREIAGRLTDLGFRISERTLQSYLWRAAKSLGAPPSQMAPVAEDDLAPLLLDIFARSEPVVGPSPWSAAAVGADEFNPFELPIQVSSQSVVGRPVQTGAAAGEDELDSFELDIEVSDEPVIDRKFEHWFQKG